MTTTEYDLIVIGAGAVGENVADRAVQGGLTALIVESELVGGDCSYWACMPSKALLRSGMVYRAAKKVGGASEAVTGDLDVAATFKRRTEIIHDWDDEGQVKWLEGAHIDLARGHGRITGVKEVTIGDTVYTARHAVCVSTGSVALLPDIPGLAGTEPWTSHDATSAKVAPKSLAIIGGGVVAVEMATAYASFGTKVTIISRSSLLAGQEPFAGELVGDSLKELGATVLLNTSPTAVSKKDGDFVVEVDGGDAIVAEKLLVAAGRVPRSMDLGLDSIGLKDGDWLEVDDTMLVKGFDWLYATGDINHRVLLTHQGKYQARAAGDVIVARALGKPVRDEAWGVHVATADHEAVPQVTFSDPEVASVGLTADAAEKAGYDTRVIDYDLSWLAGTAIQADNYVGKARMVVDEKRKVVLGVTFVGQDVGEMLQAATIAVVGEVPLDRLWHAVPAYPTMNEIWLRLLETYGRPS
ncbi:MAG TPA: NAD(P)/FAD-dependent oxidoreductase [Galbitalea sp.]|jgi:dihydrolipoamide dehydrogenase